MPATIVEIRPGTAAAESAMLRDYRDRLVRELAELDRQLEALKAAAGRLA